MDRNPSSPRPPDRVFRTAFPIGGDERVDLVGGIDDLLIAGVIALGGVKPGNHACEIRPEYHRLEATASRRFFGPSIWTFSAAADNDAVCGQGPDKTFDNLAVAPRT
jgi:hypothetical protein